MVKARGSASSRTALETRQAAARNAWKKMRSANWRAKQSVRRSQAALVAWAEEHAWRVVFLDAKRGNPRTGIVDAVLVRIAPRSPDVVQLRLIQLKGGSAGLTSSEARRLEAAVRKVDVRALHVLHDGDELSLSQSISAP